MEKERELAHLEHFKEICSFFPDGEIEKTEKPDFLVHAGEKIFGIEHSEIFQPGLSNGTSLQAQDNLGQRVVSKASQLYQQHNNRPLLVQILFNDSIMIGKKDINSLAERILLLIERTPIVVGEPRTIRRTKQNVAYFPNEIVMLHIFAHPNGKENKWRSSSGGWIREITPEYLQEKIDLKELKLDHYNSICSEIWLLIVADDLRIPSSVDLSEVVLANQYSTRFNRVFFFWNSTRRYVELQLSRNPPKST